MKAMKHPGICKICGEFKDLSAEHIPPKHAFNTNDIKVIQFDEFIKTFSGSEGRLPWDFNGLNGRIQQGGHKKYCLCHNCNNNTGQWYMRSYTDLAKTFHAMIITENIIPGDVCSFSLTNIYPLRIYKAMMTMICDINNDCFGDESLRNFIMNKKSKSIDQSKYSLYMYLVSPKMQRIGSLSAILDMQVSNDPILSSELDYYPIGFAVYLNKPSTFIPFGVNIDGFATYDYDDVCEVLFSNMPYLDINTQHPIDYRSREDIAKCIRKNENQNIIIDE